jgi:YD repeat-containing protein
MHDKQLGVKAQMTQMNADSQRGRRPIGTELPSKTITDARGGVTRFGYDLRNRRISKTYPDGSAETWGDDAVGNPVSRRTPSGKLATSLYDNRNRLVSTDWSDATPDVAFAYDAAGRVVAATISASALSYRYNAAGELVSETQEIRAPQAQLARTVGYRYDADGNRAALVYPGGPIGDRAFIGKPK